MMIDLMKMFNVIRYMKFSCCSFVICAACFDCACKHGTDRMGDDDESYKHA